MAVEVVALNAAFRALYCELGERRGHDVSLDGGDGVLLLDDKKDRRFDCDEETERCDEDAFATGRVEIDESAGCCPLEDAELEGPSAEDSALLSPVFFFFSSASFRCCSSCSRSDSLMASITMSYRNSRCQY